MLTPLSGYAEHAGYSTVVACSCASSRGSGSVYTLPEWMVVA